MITIERKYHFYAAHRNELLNDKCRNIHGHTYYVTVELGYPSTGAAGVTMLFSEIDKVVEPIVKQFDHGFIIHSKDPLYPVLTKYIGEQKDPLKLLVLPCPTSVENLARVLWEQIKEQCDFYKLGGVTNLAVSVQETNSAIVRYEPGKV